MLRQSTRGPGTTSLLEDALTQIQRPGGRATLYRPLRQVQRVSGFDDLAHSGAREQRDVKFRVSIETGHKKG